MRGIAKTTGCLLTALGCAGQVLCAPDESTVPREVAPPPRATNFYLGSSVVRMQQQPVPGSVSASPITVYSDRPVPPEPEGAQPSIVFRMDEKSALRLRGMRSGLRLVWSSAF